jgi:hypothetical protein
MLMSFSFQPVIHERAMVQYFDKDGNPITLEEHLQQALPGVIDLLATWLTEWFPDENYPANLEMPEIEETPVTSERGLTATSKK